MWSPLGNHFLFSLIKQRQGGSCMRKYGCASVSCWIWPPPSFSRTPWISGGTDMSLIKTECMLYVMVSNSNHSFSNSSKINQRRHKHAPHVIKCAMGAFWMQTIIYHSLTSWSISPFWLLTGISIFTKNISMKSSWSLWSMRLWKTLGAISKKRYHSLIA